MVGVETGGSPYASLIAKDLNIPLILLRKEAKGSLGYLAGYAKKEGGKFAIVDDVLATGNSITEAIRSIKNGHRTIKFASVLSYGMDKTIARKYNIEVVSLYQIDDVLETLNSDLSELLIPHIRAFQKNLISILEG
ncbi:MAG: phosphoribosyltransferase family protein [Patescibacteria group bacterium]